MTMKVPERVREFAMKSVNTAEQAISSFMNAAGKSVSTIPGPMADGAKQALAITENNLKASFDMPVHDNAAALADGGKLLDSD